MQDTIAAIATAMGVGGVGIVRISGPMARAIACDVVRRELPDRQVVHGIARDLDGNRIDEVLAFAMFAPRSFTGEDVAELHGHGGAVNLGRLLRAVVARGARLAEPGEFTRRAFAHGRLDLTRAEGLLAVIEAGSERAWRQAQAQLAGALGDAIRDVEQQINRVLAEIEGGIDFPDDDLDVRGQPWLRDELNAAESQCVRLAQSYAAGRLVREGIAVALVGCVNAGKSSLFNALIGRERAIVDATPGTTRDFVEATCEWEGYAVAIVDTAGERPTPDRIEQRGIELGQARAEAADVVVIVEDGVTPPMTEARYGNRALRVRSKADLPGRLEGYEVVTSVVRSQGIGELRAAILARAGGTPMDSATDAVVTTERQRAALLAAARGLTAATTALDNGTPLEMVALEIRIARTMIANVRGVEVGDSVIDEVFARFCIGK